MNIVFLWTGVTALMAACWQTPASVATRSARRTGRCVVSVCRMVFAALSLSWPGFRGRARPCRGLPPFPFTPSGVAPLETAPARAYSTPRRGRPLPSRRLLPAGSRPRPPIPRSLPRRRRLSHPARASRRPGRRLPPWACRRRGRGPARGSPARRRRCRAAPGRRPAGPRQEPRVAVPPASAPRAPFRAAPSPPLSQAPGASRRSRGRAPAASSSFPHLSSSTGWPISCRRRGSTGTACRLETSQGCSPRITSSGLPSRPRILAPKVAPLKGGRSPDREPDRGQRHCCRGRCRRCYGQGEKERGEQEREVQGRVSQVHALRRPAEHVCWWPHWLRW
jgi:hypothetical protein